MPWPTSTPAWAELPGIDCAPLGVTAGVLADCGLWIVTWRPDPPKDVVQSWAGALTAGERERAERIGTSHGRLRLLASHAALARLATATALPNVSMSHTRWCAAVAASARPVGVDVEADVPRPGWRASRAARRSTSGDGSGATGPGTVQSPDSWQAFLRMWIEAEARFKAGVAGGDPADVLEVDVPATDSRPAHVLALVCAPR